MKKVLVTGISGFVGQHCAVELLRSGYAVKGSVRNLSKITEVTKGIEKVISPKGRLEFCELNLLKDDGWARAMEACDYVLHIASPFFIAEPKDENEMIKPAVEGTLRALKFAKEAGVKKVVVTSSTVAMTGDKKINRLTQESWTNPKTDKVTAYMKSKALAELAAWDFYTNQTDEEKIKLTVINPGPIFGPTLTGHICASLEIIKRLINGKMPMQPNCNYVMSDVRDVAKIQVASLENEDSTGKRLIVTSAEKYAFTEIAAILQKNGFKKAKPRKAPGFLLKIISLFNREAKGMLPLINADISADISPTQNLFNWEPIPLEKTLIDAAISIQETHTP